MRQRRATIGRSTPCSTRARAMPRPRGFADALRADVVDRTARGDRGGQAPVAVQGRHRRRSRPGDAGPCVRARRSVVRVRPHRRRRSSADRPTTSAAVRAAVAAPVLRKDFTVVGARRVRCAADGCRRGAADRRRARRPRAGATSTRSRASCGLDALVEVHDEARARTGRRGRRDADRCQPARPRDVRGRHGSRGPCSRR